MDSWYIVTCLIYTLLFHNWMLRDLKKTFLNFTYIYPSSVYGLRPSANCENFLVIQLMPRSNTRLALLEWTTTHPNPPQPFHILFYLLPSLPLQCLWSHLHSFISFREILIPFIARDWQAHIPRYQCPRAPSTPECRLDIVGSNIGMGGVIGSVFTGRPSHVVAAEERRPRKGEVSQK